MGALSKRLRNRLRIGIDFGHPGEPMKHEKRREPSLEERMRQAAEAKDRIKPRKKGMITFDEIADINPGDIIPFYGRDKVARFDFNPNVGGGFYDTPKIADKIDMAILMFQSNNPGIRVSVQYETPGDYVNFMFEGIAVWRVANTFIAATSPQDLVYQMEKQVRYRQPKMPVDFKGIWDLDKAKQLIEDHNPNRKREGVSSAEDWADKWAKKNGGSDGQEMGSQ